MVSDSAPVTEDTQVCICCSSSISLVFFPIIASFDPCFFFLSSFQVTAVPCAIAEIDAAALVELGTGGDESMAKVKLSAEVEPNETDGNDTGDSSDDAEVEEDAGEESSDEGDSKEIVRTLEAHFFFSPFSCTSGHVF